MTFSEHLVGSPTQPPWHSLALQKRDYSQGTNRYPRPDFSVNAKYPQITESWEFKTGYTIASTPAVWKDLAIVGDVSGTIYALSVGSGKPAWSLKTGGPVYSTPEIAGEAVVVPSTDGTIYALNASNGQERWRFRTSRPIVASPAAAKGLVFVGSSEGKFRALDVVTGKLAWEFNGLGGFVESKPRIYQGKVIFGAWDQHLYSLEAASGKLAWKWQGDKPGVLFSPAACWPVAANGKVFIVAPDRKLTAIDASSGAEIWRTGAYPVRESIGRSRDQSRLYVRSIQDSIYAFSTATSEPHKLWEVDAGFGYDINSAMLIEKEGTLFYGTKNGLVLALDPKNGTMRWQHRIGVGVVNTLAPLSADRVLATDFDGKIVLLSAKQ
jgi:outer membrane protein assembly factor BamB